MMMAVSVSTTTETHCYNVGDNTLNAVLNALLMSQILTRVANVIFYILICIVACKYLKNTL